MRKLASIALITVYSLLSVGVTVLVHTCGGYKTVDVMPASMGDPCACDDATSDEPCCTLVVKTFHLDDDQNAARAVALASLDFTLGDYSDADDMLYGENIAFPISVDSSPPSSPPLTILHCAFLI